MQDGVMVTLDRLIYTPDRNKHSVAVYEQSNSFAEHRDWKGTFKAAIAPTLDEAVEKIRLQVHEWLSVREQNWHDVILSSFTFDVKYSDIKDGLLWVTPSTYPSISYPVVKEKEE